MILAGARIKVVDDSDQHFGEFGTVTRGEYPAVLNRRPMVEVRIDGQPWMYDVGYYVEQIEELPVLKAVA